MQALLESPSAIVETRERLKSMDNLRLFTGNAVRCDAPAADIRMNLMRLEAWGRSGPFPPVEGGALGPQSWLNGS